MLTTLCIFVWIVAGAFVTFFAGDGGWLVQVAHKKRIIFYILIVWLLWPVREAVAKRIYFAVR